jgi:hypothetical protein
MKKTPILISIGLLSALSGTSLACNQYFSQEYGHYSHRDCIYEPEEIYLLFKMVQEYNLPLDPLSEWSVESAEKWEVISQENSEIKQEYQNLFKRHNFRGLKECAELIQDAFWYAGIPEWAQEAFSKLITNTDDFEDLSEEKVELIEQIQTQTEDWYNRVYQKLLPYEESL